MSKPIADTAVRLPAPALRPFITQYAGFRVSGLPCGVHFGLPSSDVHLIISLGDPIEVVQMPNSMQRPSALTALVSGLQNAPAVVRQNRYVFGLHVFIKPLGVRAILGVASEEISSLVLNLSDIWGNGAESLIETLLGAHTWHERFAVLDRAFVSKLNPFSPQREISWAWERLAKSHGSVPVQQLADEIGYSRRHFSERFREMIGVTPKLVARVLRFERACRLIADNRLGLAQVAIVCGYYDQAHLTREWYAFASCSPNAWITRELPFLQDYELGCRDNESHDLESKKASYIAVKDSRVRSV
jgi:AraC-like DNA-binding protein